MPRRATYVYCVVHRATRPAMRGVPPGVPGASRPLVHQAGPSWWLVVSEVPLNRYGDDLERRLGDLEWVSRVAIAHEAVVEHFTASRGAAVVPMKLFTIFSSPERAVSEIAGRRSELRAIVRRIRGCEEWGVRITRGAAPGPANGDGPGAIRRPSGTAFLQSRKRARDSARESAARAARAAEDALRRLAAIAREWQVREAPDGAASPPLVDAALLVPVARRLRFRAAARRVAQECRQAGADVAVTGPWPAYHFVGPEHGG